MVRKYMWYRFRVTDDALNKLQLYFTLYRLIVRWVKNLLGPITKWLRCSFRVGTL